MGIKEIQNEDQLAGFVFISIMVLVFLFAGWQSLGWDRATGQFPIVVCVPAVVLGILALMRDGSSLKVSYQLTKNGFRGLVAESQVARELPKASLLLLSLAGIVGATVLLLLSVDLAIGPELNTTFRYKEHLLKKMLRRCRAY